MYAVDHTDDGVVGWRLTADGATPTAHPDYAPSIYVGDPVTALYGPGDPPAREGLSDALADHRDWLTRDRRVVDTAVVERRQTWRTAPRPVLRVDVADVGSVTSLARRVHERGRPGEVTCYDVDLDPKFRFCLDAGVDPTPRRALRTLAFRLPGCDRGRGVDALPGLRCEGERLGATPAAVCRAVADRVADADPDVLVVDAARVIPLLFEAAADAGVDLRLGRRPGYRKLAGASTYTSYGRVGHSPARYDVPGRAVVDESRSFLLDEAGLTGALDLVERSRTPLSELAPASIGTVLTAMQVREARERGVLVPWRPWRPEFHTPAGTLDDADRGGVTLAPATGVHEDVHELDFSSLYPNVIRTRNVSPETVRCDCCENDAVPGLGYSICDDRGYLPDVLGPLIDDRDAIKRALAADDDPDRVAELEGRSAALKWVLVACFGYQGFANAKFGRVECHEAINAYAREILLDAKAALEAGGWRVLHGVVDGLWVTPRPDRERTPLDDLVAGVTDAVGIRLEYEAAYDWLAFPPLRDAEGGALTRYFGRRRDGSYTYRGVDCRRDDTPPFVAAVQRALVETFDWSRSPAAVCDRLDVAIRRLRDGRVDPDRLVIRRRVSKPLDEYDRDTRTVAALRRVAARGGRVAPGQSVAFVVVDDDATTADRVALADEVDGDTRVDRSHYRDRLVRAATSVVSAVGWDADDVREHRRGDDPATLAEFV